MEFWVIFFSIILDRPPYTVSEIALTEIVWKPLRLNILAIEESEI